MLRKLKELFKKEIPDLDEKIGLVRRKAIWRVLIEGRVK